MLFRQAILKTLLYRGKNMGFFDTLGKIVYGAGDIMAAVGEQTAKNIDNMTDEEIEKRHFKSAQMIRRDAAMMDDDEIRGKYFRDAGEVRRDAAQMSNEELKGSILYQQNQ